MTDHTAALARIAEIRRDPSNYADPATASVCIEAGLFRDDGILVDGAGDVMELVNGVEEIARLTAKMTLRVRVDYDKESGKTRVVTVPESGVAVTSIDLTRTFDARDWARAFVKIAATKPDIVRDEGAMIAWFANALMRGHDEHARLTAPSPTIPDEEESREREEMRSYLLALQLIAEMVGMDTSVEPDAGVESVLDAVENFVAKNAGGCSLHQAKERVGSHWLAEVRLREEPSPSAHQRGAAAYYAILREGLKPKDAHV